MATRGMRSAQPRIGVSWIRSDKVEKDRYMVSVNGAGGEAVALPAEADSWTALLATIQGLVLTGGADIGPRVYGLDDRGSIGVIDRRDDLELEALRFCLDRGIPVLAICRGMQLSNAALGGKLIQDIDITDVPHRPNYHVSSHHPIEIFSNSILAKIIGANGRVEVNSRHHQGLSEALLAPGLRISALASDGIVEGLEMTGEQFLVGVQCHPERQSEVPVMVPLFTALVEQALMTDEVQVPSSASNVVNG